ncbi:S8 family serine peptidase [Flexithrix dorotheae]|uniref:S8 family serine peptidase n=1 Tax=Flexithrix dorotheae TaxID=70993 RepID=UPI00039E62FC|nr:S8 family serine peptidase [Flexithrix dorotheae]
MIRLYSLLVFFFFYQIGFCQQTSQLPSFVPNEIIISYENIESERSFSSIKNKLETEYSGLANALSENLDIEIKEKHPAFQWLTSQMILNNLSENQLLNSDLKIDRKEFTFSQNVVLKFSSRETAVEILNKIREQGQFGSYRIKSASLNGLNYFNIIPNDSLYTEQWAHKVCKTEIAWNTQTGSSSVIIGIIDSGADPIHEDLTENLVPGFDFVDIDTTLYKEIGFELYSEEDYTNPDNNPIDFNGHGTHCTGIIGATSNNTTGIAGVCQKASLMPLRSGFSLKYNDTEVSILEDDDIANAIIYAANHNVDILNMSFGGGYSEIVKDAIDYAHSKGMVLIAAAGNSNSINLQYPAGYSNVIAVAASNQSDQKIYYSNFGDWIDITAPGENIISTVPKSGGRLHHSSGYRTLSGTSMAAPYVSGLAGLILSQYPSYTNKQVKAALINTTDNIDSLNQEFKKKLGTGRVNSKQAINNTPHPNIFITHITVNDSLGNLNGVINPDETISLEITLENIWKDAENVSMKINTSDPFVTLIDSFASLGTIKTFTKTSNKERLLHLKVDSKTPDNHEISLHLEVSATGYNKKIPFTLTVRVIDIIKIPTDFPSIQQGIDAADEGDLIVVDPGHYYETINFKGKNISVVSRFYDNEDESYIKETVIDGSKTVDLFPNDSINGSVVFIGNGEDHTAKLIGFTLTGGGGSNVQLPGMFTPNYLGGAILCYNSSPELKHLRVINNQLDSPNGSGAGICITQCTNAPLLNNITFEQNKGSAAINVSSYSKAKIHSVKILNNRDGNGIRFHTSNGEVINSKIENCIGAVATGLMGVNVEKLIVLNTEITHNARGTDFRAAKLIDIRNSVISNNFQDGGMWAVNSSINLINCTLAYNFISNHYGGGAIFISSPSKINIVNSILYNNKWRQLITNDTLSNSISFLNDEGSILSAFSNIEEGAKGIHFFNGAENINIDWLEGNMDTIPLFHYPVLTDYHLKESSPLKEKGTAYFEFNGETLVALKSIDYIGQKPDMGAYLRPESFIRPLFEVNKTIGRNPLTVKFTNSSYAFLTSVPDSFLWKFGDGESSNLANPTHNFTEPGIYTVELHAFNDLNEGKIIKTDLIKVYDPGLIYVDPKGSDISGDGSISNPFKTIQHSINIAAENDIIVVNRGIYKENLLLSGKDITLTSQFFFSNDKNDIYQTIIDGNQNGSVLTINNYVTSETKIRGLTIQNGARLGEYIEYDGGGIYIIDSDPEIHNCIIKDNKARFFGGGIFMESANPIIENCTIDNNTVVHSYDYSNGGGIYIGNYANPKISKTVISNNSASNEGGGIFTDGPSKPLIEQVTFYNNKSINKNSGGFYRGFSTNSTIRNSIFWNNTPKQIDESSGRIPLKITYSNIQNGYPGMGNINKYPQFADVTQMNFGLLEDSPCIDKGDPGSDLDIDSTRADMGAYYFHHQPLRIKNSPSDMYICEWNNVSLKVNAEGQFPLSYTWYKNDMLLSDSLESLNIENIRITDNGVYHCIVKDRYDNSVTINKINVSIQVQKDTIMNVSICEGGSYFAGGKYQTKDGVYYDTLQSSFGCDSIIITNLTVTTLAKTNIIDTSICEGSSYFVEGNYQNQAGTYYDTLQGSFGCDSIIITNLTITPIVETITHPTICRGESYLVGSKSLKEAGVYYDTLSGFLGCDSVIITNLSVTPNSETIIDTTICLGENYFAEGDYQMETGVYYDTLRNQFNCDSIIISHLNFSVCTGLDRMVSTDQKYIYPNPSKGTINIEVKKFEEIIIYDINGKVYGRFKNKKIDISNFPNGLYMILIKIDSKNNFAENILLTK